jgi:hypothetical protein
VTRSRTATPSCVGLFPHEGLQAQPSPHSAIPVASALVTAASTSAIPVSKIFCSLHQGFLEAAGQGKYNSLLNSYMGYRVYSLVMHLII